MKKISCILIVAITIFIASCNKDTVIPNKVVSVPTPASVKFSTDVYPIFATYACTDCHSIAGGSAGGLNYDGTPSATRLSLLNDGLDPIPAVTPSNSANSLLYNYFSGGASHHGLVMTATEITNVKGWIDQGALDN
ncbi:MAG: hypothetical protein HXX09_05565 [Bacteroidetes bacterium]|nr:hypothetical protein [Bacteroidota bacterium]